MIQDNDLKNEQNASFHFIAIGGVGQSGLAKILATKGFKVTGSDIKESKYTKMLENMNVKVSIGHRAENIEGYPAIVLSSAIKDDNPEVIKAKELGLKLYHRSDILKLISESYPIFIGFSGTHGKTTTSGLCSYILEKMGENPAYASGGIISGLDVNSNAYPNSKIFVAELDESDGTIVKYKPDYIVINNLESDHFDFYKNGESDLIEQFKIFAKNLKPSSKVFVNIDDIGIQKLMPFLKNTVTYSIKDKNADYFASDIENSSYTLYKNGVEIKRITPAINGVHNVYNTMAVIAVLLDMGFDINNITPHISTFGGMKRRFEVVYDREIKVIDDYAHHPTEIKATLEAAKKLTKRNIVAIFQPHRYTRLKALWKEFMESFKLADELFVVDAYSAGDNFDPEFNSENFSKEISHKNVRYIKGAMDSAAKEISKYIKKDDFIITIGAGDVTKIGHSLGECYEKRGN